MSGDCPATVYIDGVRIDQLNTPVDDYLELDRIAGVEVYARDLNAPVQYSNTGPECGSVLYWTKDLVPDDPGGWTATKVVLGSAAITGLLLLLVVR